MQRKKFYLGTQIEEPTILGMSARNGELAISKMAESGLPLARTLVYVHNHGPVSASDIALALGSSEKSEHRLLIALAREEVVEVNSEGLYSITDVGVQLL